MATQAHSLSYAGCNFLRQRLVLSTLSGRPVKIRKIRARDDNPGLRGNSGRQRAGWARGPRGCGADTLGAVRGEPARPSGASRRPSAALLPHPRAPRAEGGRRGRARGVCSAERCAGVSRALLVNSYTFSSTTCCNKSQASPPRLPSVPLAHAVSLSKDKGSFLDRNVVIGQI